MPRFIMPDKVFYNTSTSLMPLKLPFPAGMSTAISHVQSDGNLPSLKSFCTRLITRSQFSISGSSSHVAAASHPWRCSSLITDLPPYWCFRSHRTSLLTSYPWRTELSIGELCHLHCHVMYYQGHLTVERDPLLGHLCNCDVGRWGRGVITYLYYPHIR